MWPSKVSTYKKNAPPSGVLDGGAFLNDGGEPIEKIRSLPYQ